MVLPDCLELGYQHHRFPRFHAVQYRADKTTHSALQMISRQQPPTRKEKGTKSHGLIEGYILSPSHCRPRTPCV